MIGAAERFMTDANADSMGRQIDSLRNALAATRLPLPPHIHVDGMKSIIESAEAELRKVYIAETGDDPWEDHPDLGPP